MKIQAIHAQMIKQVAQANRELTASLVTEYDLTPPFPEFPSSFAQRIKAQEDEFNRAWRMKQGAGKGLLVLASVATYGLHAWYHVSFSRRDKVPSYDEILWVREHFFSPDMKAIQVFPKKSNHVNFHPNCLHLWANLCVDPLPNFDVLGLV